MRSLIASWLQSHKPSLVDSWNARNGRTDKQTDTYRQTDEHTERKDKLRYTFVVVTSQAKSSQKVTRYLIPVTGRQNTDAAADANSAGVPVYCSDTAHCIYQ